MNSEQTTAEQQQVLSQPAVDQPLAPIAQFDCWYLPEGQQTIFGLRKHVAVFYPGWMVLYDKTTHAEVKKIAITPDVKVKYFLGSARIAQTNGQKYSFFNRRMGFIMDPLWPYLFLLATLVFDIILRFAFFNVPVSSANIGWRLLSLVLMVVAFIMFGVVSMPRAKAFKEAAHRAAGVAH